MRRTEFVPELLPNLSRGRHFTPRSGACFMEFASFLAGERWSDHPKCTDPVLAAMARGVNDLVDDEHRSQLIHDIPRVVGARGDDVLGLRIALRAAISAIPVASMDRQHALAVGILLLLRELGEREDLPADVRNEAEAALDEVPDARSWAEFHLSQVRLNRAQFARHGAVSIVRTSVLGIAEACVPDADTRLVAMLHDTLDDVEAALASGRDDKMIGAEDAVTPAEGQLAKHR
tara:strand:- start:72678 stop:73376 length:699 start_codon:yes stop_codon:yes gene_type:complete